jgi:glycosyltransferase involved in cell wall biosynthesis
MAYGLPVVGTPRAAEALLPGVASHVDTGNTADEMASKIVVLLRDSQLAYRRGIDGRHQVAEDYRWDQSLDQVLQLLENPLRESFTKIEPRLLSPDLRNR